MKIGFEPPRQSELIRDALLSGRSMAETFELVRTWHPAATYDSVKVNRCKQRRKLGLIDAQGGEDVRLTLPPPVLAYFEARATPPRSRNQLMALALRIIAADDMIAAVIDIDPPPAQATP